MIVEDPSVEDIARMDGFEATGLAGLRDPVAALECPCTCHTRRFGMPTADMHDEGRTCPCQRARGAWAAPHDWLDEPLLGSRWREERRDLASPIDAERMEALDVARRHGMQIRIEHDLEPTVISGRYGGHQFWYHERQGDWQLHLDDLDGPVIAESGFIDLVEAVELIRDRLDRCASCSRCGVAGGESASAFCSDCGQPIAASGFDGQRRVPR